MLWPLLTAVLFVAASAPAEDKKDEKLIEGTWIVVSREMDGKKTPADELKRGNLIFRNGTITGDDGKKKEKAAAYRLDPSISPKAIDLTDSEKEPTRAIYELDGDTLKMCWSEKAPDIRPAEF